MADDEQLEIISEDGVQRWNSWRAENPEALTDISGADIQHVYLQGANFENTNLQGANLQGSDFQRANFQNATLQGANLQGVKLQSANLQRANLQGANLQGAILQGANLLGASLQDANLTQAQFQNTKLQGANFRGASFEAAAFDGAKLSEHTLGLGRLTQGQRSSMNLVEVTPIPEDMTQEPNTEISIDANSLTVGYARSIVGPAHLALQGLSIPNDISEEHRDLFDELLSTVAELEKNLADIQEENRLLSDENENLRNAIDQSLPLWKRAWEEFILKGAGAIGASAGKGAVFTAGFIAGMLYVNFSSVGQSISV